MPDRLREALIQLNPDVPGTALAEAFRKITLADAPSLVQNNRTFHRMLVDGVPVEFAGSGGCVVYDTARLVDFEDPDNNDWVAVNQFTVVEGHFNRRPDVVLFLNGLPVAVVEPKNAADEKATVWSAFNQLQTYKQHLRGPLQRHRGAPARVALSG